MAAAQRQVRPRKEGDDPESPVELDGEGTAPAAARVDSSGVGTPETSTNIEELLKEQSRTLTQAVNATTADLLRKYDANVQKRFDGQELRIASLENSGVLQLKQNVVFEERIKLLEKQLELAKSQEAANAQKMVAEHEFQEAPHA